MPEGKHLLARSVMGVSESKKIFFNDELRPLACEKKQMSPLEPTDFCIAQLAAKPRKAKAKAVVVHLRFPEKVEQDSILKTGSHCDPAKLRQKKKKRKTRRGLPQLFNRPNETDLFKKLSNRTKVQFFATRKSFFSSKNVIHKGVTGEDKLI